MLLRLCSPSSPPKPCIRRVLKLSALPFERTSLSEDAIRKDFFDVRAAMLGAIEKLDRTLSTFAQLQQSQQHRLQAVEKALEYATKHDVTLDVAPRARGRTGYPLGNKGNVYAPAGKIAGYQSDAPAGSDGAGGADCVTSTDCYARAEAEKFKETIESKLMSSLQFVRIVGDGINALNTTVAELLTANRMRDKFVNVLSMDVEVLRDQTYRNKRRSRSCDVRVKQLIGRVEQLELIAKRVEDMESVLHSLVYDVGATGDLTM